MSEPLTVLGYIYIDSWGDADDCVFVAPEPKGRGYNEPLAEQLSEHTKHRWSVRYWITDKPVESADEANEAFLRRLDGDAEVEFISHYSDITGYLWTDEELNVGGHDLLAELRTHAGKWLVLEIDVEPAAA